MGTCKFQELLFYCAGAGFGNQREYGAIFKPVNCSALIYGTQAYTLSLK